MARTINTAYLLGRVGADPELRKTDSGSPVTSIRVATDRRTKAGQEPLTDWHSVVCWGTTAELVARHVGRGDRVFVSGRLSYRTYEGSDGQPRTIAEINASDVVFLDRATQRTAQALPAADPQDPPAPF